MDKIRKDQKTNLLDLFKQFEISGSQIFGGRITGCNQNGTTTTFDSTVCGCACYTFNNDRPGHCDAFTPQK